MYEEHKEGVYAGETQQSFSPLCSLNQGTTLTDALCTSGNWSEGIIELCS